MRGQSAQHAIRATGALRQFWGILRITLALDAILLNLLAVLIGIFGGFARAFDGESRSSLSEGGVLSLGAAAAQVPLRWARQIRSDDVWDLILVLSSCIVALAIATLGVERSDSELARRSLRQLRALAQFIGFVTLNLGLMLLAQIRSNVSFVTCAVLACGLILAFACVAASRSLQADTRNQLVRERQAVLASVRQTFPLEASRLERKVDQAPGSRPPVLRYVLIAAGWLALVFVLTVGSATAAITTHYGLSAWPTQAVSASIGLVVAIFFVWCLLIFVAAVLAEIVILVPNAREKGCINVLRWTPSVAVLVLTGPGGLVVATQSGEESLQVTIGVLLSVGCFATQAMVASPLAWLSRGSKSGWTPRGAARFARVGFELRKADRLTHRIEVQKELFGNRRDRLRARSTGPRNFNSSRVPKRVKVLHVRKPFSSRRPRS